MANLSRDELDQAQNAASTSFGFDVVGAFARRSIRRSIRRMGTLRERLFRLPATPRLSRANRRILVGRGEECTGWNFARSAAEDGRPLDTSSYIIGVGSPPATPRLARQRKLQLPPGGGLQQTAVATLNEHDCPLELRNAIEEQMMGGSCRLPNESAGGRRGGGVGGRVRLPIPSFEPPPANEAKNTIHEHLRSLLPSPPALVTNQQRKFLFLLPDTSYDRTGEIASARWRNNGRQRIFDEEEPNSPTQSGITLLSARHSSRGGVAMRSMSSSSASGRNRHSRASYRASRPSYPLNGLFHRQASNHLRGSESASQADDDGCGNSLGNGHHLELPPLPPLPFPWRAADDRGEYDSGDGVQPFLGREWAFKELCKTVLAERSPLTAILGEPGTGKSALLDQLVLHSPFNSHETSNANTVDSGIVVEGGEGRRVSADSSTFTSVNYEWLGVLSSRLAAFHKCHLHSAASCGVAEFVRNISAHMCRSPLLRDTYSRQVLADTELRRLISDGVAALGVEPVELFRRLVLRPLATCTSATSKGGQVRRNDVEKDKCDSEEAIVIVVDAVDEAGYHRSDGSESIGWLLSKTVDEFPGCLRVIVTAANSTSWRCETSMLRTIRLDDAELDERVSRDSRIYIDYRLAVKPEVEQQIRMRRCSSNPLLEETDPVFEFVEEIMARARGNQLFTSLLMGMIEEERIRIKSTSLSLLPATVQQLYLLYFNSTFSSPLLFNSISPILAVVLASLRPLKFEELYEVLNSPSPPNSGRQLVAKRDLEHRISLIPLIKRDAGGHYVPFHVSFRDWLLKDSPDTEYFVDVRYGHILLSVALVRRGTLNPEELFELGHHLLKANPHKYMNPTLATDLPIHKHSQVAWIQIAAGDGLAEALLYNRNTFYTNIKVSRLLLSAGANANAIWPESGESLLSSFSCAGNCEMIDLLIAEYRASVDYVNPTSGRSPLIGAVANGRVGAAKLLISRGADRWAVDNEGTSALAHAARSGSLEMIACMLECEYADEMAKPPPPDVVNDAFEVAIKAGHVDICRYFLDNCRSTLNASAAMRFACTCGQTDVVQFLLSRGVALEAGDQAGPASSLLCAVESGSCDLVASILKGPRHVDADCSNEGDSRTALMIAAGKGHMGIVELLLSTGADMNRRDGEGRTAVMYAIEGGHFPVASVLFERGADPGMKDDSGNTLLHYLASHPNKQLINRLMDSGQSLEEKNNEDMRPLEVAIREGNHAAIEIFLRHGARLRSFTWHMARRADPDILLILTKKLLDDASILLRRKKPGEALHRLNYALQKCNELLEKCQGGEADTSSTEPSTRSPLPSLTPIEGQLRQYKLQALLSIAYMKRHNGEFHEAIELSEEAARLTAPGDNSSASIIRYELHLFRAKCFFDSQNVEAAREEARLAYSILPTSPDVQNLLVVLDKSCQLTKRL